MTAITVTELLDATQSCLEGGLSIIPIDHHNKRPYWQLLPRMADPRTGEAKPTWKPYQERKATEQELEQWLQAGMHAYAVVCGKVSGNLEIIDFDVNGFYERWLAKVGSLADGLPVQRTGGGGYQVFYRAPNRQGNQKLAWAKSDKDATGREIAIETRGEGGYAVVAPSLHPSGNYYTMLSGDLANVPVIPEAVANVLVDAARRLCEMPYTKQELVQMARRNDQEHSQRAGASDGVIADYNNSTPIRDALRRQGYTDAERGRMSRPGKADSAGVIVLDGENVCFPWSSNDPLHRTNGDGKPLPMDPFSVLVQYEYSGDSKAAYIAVKKQQGKWTEATPRTTVEPETGEDEPPTQTGDDSDNGDDSKQKGSGKQSKEAKPKQADELYKLVLKQAHLFRGRQDGYVYASVAVDGHRECYRMKSERFNDWLSYTYFQQHGTAVSAQAKADAKNLLAFEAYKSVEDVFVRVGHLGGKVYIDLGSPEGDAIEVDATGWRVVPVPPVHFRRPETMLPLPLPTEHKDPLILQRFLNIEEADWPLLAAWVVAALHPRGPYPVLAFLSRAGSGKSTQLRVLKRILDPSSAELRTQLSDVRDLFIAAANSWVLAFDNVSQLSPEVSDALCVIATGGGFTRKANYTDQEESVINVQRPILINGIGDIIARQDLMDRAIVIGTPYISEERRLDEEDFWRGFEENKAKILGSFLYALSVGLANIHTVQLTRKPRMADFAKIAIAAEPAYTDSRLSFIDAYTENRDRAAETIVENSPVAEVLLRVMGTSTQLEETPESLFLKMQAETTNEYERKADGWPKHHNQLKETLERVAPALDRLGVRVEHSRGAKGKRLFRVTRLTSLSD